MEGGGVRRGKDGVTGKGKLGRGKDGGTETRKERVTGRGKDGVTNREKDGDRYGGRAGADNIFSCPLAEYFEWFVLTKHLKAFATKRKKL